jgi:cytochrome b561
VIAGLECIRLSAYRSELWNKTMQFLSSRRHYGAVARSFHWLTVILVGSAYIVSTGGPESRVYSAAMDFTRQTHETLGILVFAVALLRILWRRIDRAPEEPPMPAWMTLSSRAVHLALYALLVGIPAMGILGAWLEGHPLTLLAGTAFGPLLPRQHELGRAVTEIHTTLGNVIIWLAALHALAALLHHFVLRDGLLASMLPGAQRTATQGADMVVEEGR